ncbi:PstS family phosphate ABC transporter substrate-binding protein [Streptomyces sp. enrichment culture]|uniref:PstS family phosphate ABC transporter substrate-binding protein n=1 Tax=Streptomyces sp. enrichment culture TaxID=1795815 RepID=UPI003F57453C
MEWLSLENVIAIGTSVLGLLVPIAMFLYDRRVPRRKLIGYRVQMDSPIGDGSFNPRLGDFDVPNMADASLVLLRIENDGSQSVADNDYTSSEVHGLTAEFTGRTVQAVSVTQPSGIEHLNSHFTNANGFEHVGSTVTIPRVPLNPGDHFKLLVLLSGGPAEGEVKLIGGLRDGRVHRNSAPKPDEKQRTFSLPARLLSGALALAVLALAGIILLRVGNPIECEQGELTLTGSTAFEPVVRTIAAQYADKCQGADISVEARGSEDGVSQLAELGERSPSAARSVIAFSDGPMGERWDLTGTEVALSFFTLVVHKDVDLGPRGLSPQQVRDIYAGEYRRWGEVVPGRKELADLPIVLVSRGDESGTRQIFQDRVLKGWERAPSTSLDCGPAAAAGDTVTRCELGSTRAVLDKVEEQPGAIGYSEVGLAVERGAGLNRVPLDGDWPNPEQIDLGAGPYPYKDVEYAYTYGPAPAGSLAASFLAYLDESTSQITIRSKGHLPCLREPEQCR